MNSTPLVFSRRLARAALLGLLLVCNGCSPEVTVRAVVDDLPSRDADTGAIVVPASALWTDTGIDLRQGQPVTLTATGTITPGGDSQLGQGTPVGPEGTYFYSDHALSQMFPLPAAQDGPAPCYGLMGRIGDGEPFHVGYQQSFAAETTGRLYLGVNDFDHADNSGAFRVRADFPAEVQPLRFEEQVTAAGDQPTVPVPGARVVVFYMDGLRPDVVREMASLGHIPTLRRLFVDGGVWLGDTFTGFPSDTITSNGTMWTGCFSDRHGLKGQVRFSRRSLYSESYLEPLGPNRSSRLLQPQGIDRLVQSAQTESIELAVGDGAGDRWRQSQTTGVPPLYEHLRRQGGDWATGILPMMTEVPPLLWTRSLIRHMPYFRAQDAWQYIDDANTHFTLKHLIAKDLPVTIVWLPETDSVSHKRSRGQFGVTRRTIALADRLVAAIEKSLADQGLLDSTYFMLVSDHGHHGGRESYLTHFDLANELFHRPRQVDAQGHWVGGGLGLSVRQHRYWNRHPEDSSREFVFVDGDSDGAARIFLPVGHFRSGQWFGTSRPADLLAYQIDAKLPPINLPETIVATQAVDGRGLVRNPIDLVLMRLSDNAMLITTQDRGQAVIDRRLTVDSKWVYRYRVVQNVLPLENGEVGFDVVDRPLTDPLGLLPLLSVADRDQFHDEQTWLRITAATRYPDSVVALTRHMLWQSNLKYREDEYAPDLVVTARPNWYFGTNSSPGTMHGYPLSDSMRATWFVSGPNIRRGARLREPTRLADLTPTILYLSGTDADWSEFDGRVVTEILEPETRFIATAGPEPLYWRDVDLQAWRALPYEPAAPYEFLPWSINRPQSGWDISNIAYNLISLGDISVFRIFDDVLSPLTGGREYVVGSVETAEQTLWKVNEPLGEAGRVLDLSGVTLSDYSQTSLGNLTRVDRAIDWVQKRTQEIDRQVAGQFGAEQTPGSPILHGGIDLAQWTVWETYRFVQRVVVQVLDETLLNGLENTADRSVNYFRRVPAEVPVDAER